MKAMSVAVADLRMHAGGHYPHKISFRAGRVLYECDRNGKRLKVTR